MVHAARIVVLPLALTTSAFGLSAPGCSQLRPFSRHPGVPRPLALLSPHRRPTAIAAHAATSSEGAPKLARAYQVAGIASLASWVAVSTVALSFHASLVLPLQHNVLTIAQALCFPVPIMASFFVALSAAAHKGGDARLRSATYRRLNLGLAAASLGLAAAAAAPAHASRSCAAWVAEGAFATGYALVPPALRYAAAAAHALAAALCLATWLRAVQPPLGPGYASALPGRLARGVVGSFWALAPRRPATGAAALDDPDASDGRAEYALLALLFLGWAVWPLLQSFPAATVPSFLGKRMARPAAVFSLLAGISAFALKDAAERGRLGASTFVTLRRGLGLGSGLHLALCLAKLAGADAGGRAALHTYYPSALAAPGASVASLLVHGLALFVACTPPKETQKQEL